MSELNYFRQHDEPEELFIETERPEKKDDIRLYEQMKAIADTAVEKAGKPKPKEYFRSVIEAVFSYVKAIDNLSRSRGHDSENFDRFSVQSADQARRSAHNVLIDAITIYARVCKINGLDNSWANLLQYDRERIMHWAQNVESYLTEDKSSY